MNKILIGTLLALSTIVISGVSINHLKKSADNTSANTSNIPESITKDNLRFALKDDIIKLIPLMKQIVDMKKELSKDPIYKSDYGAFIEKIRESEPIPLAVDSLISLEDKLINTGLFDPFNEDYWHKIRWSNHEFNTLDTRINIINTTTSDYDLFCYLICCFETTRGIKIRMSYGVAHNAEDILQVLIRLNELSKIK